MFPSDKGRIIPVPPTINPRFRSLKVRIGMIADESLARSEWVSVPTLNKTRDNLRVIIDELISLDDDLAQLDPDYQAQEAA